MGNGPPLYALLPEHYRNRDADTGFALKALTELLDGPRALIEADIGALYRDWFVETCADGALHRLAALTGREGPAPLAADRRALVADAIGFARRKGTYAALEHELGATTGWPVQIVFDAGTATIRYWEEPAYALREAAPYSDGAGRYRFHPMGVDCPLFTAPRPHAGIEARFDETLDAPVGLTREAPPAFLSRALAILIEDKDGRFQPIPATDMAAADLGEWDVPARIEARVLIDPLLGRFMFREPPAKPRRVAVDFAYAATGNVGGGAYEREMARTDESTWIAYVHGDARPSSGAFRTFEEALEAYREVPDHGLIRILDSGAYDVGGQEVGAAPRVCPAAPNAPRRLTIEALSGETPVLRGTLRAVGGVTGLHLALSGLWIAGRIEIEGEVEVRIGHCSVHPVVAHGQAGAGAIPAISVASSSGAPQSLVLHACLTGPLEAHPGLALTVSQSVVDGKDGKAVSGWPAATLSCCTLLGGADFASLQETETIFGGPTTVAAEEDRASHRLAPQGVGRPGASHGVTEPPAKFESTVFGRPGYARPVSNTNVEVHAGASNCAQRGVFHTGYAAQRLRLMHTTLAGALPIGMSYRIERQPLGP